MLFLCKEFQTSPLLTYFFLSWIVNASSWSHELYHAARVLKNIFASPGSFTIQQKHWPSSAVWSAVGLESDNWRTCPLAFAWLFLFATTKAGFHEWRRAARQEGRCSREENGGRFRALRHGRAPSPQPRRRGQYELWELTIEHWLSHPFSIRCCLGDMSNQCVIMYWLSWYGRCGY